VPIDPDSYVPAYQQIATDLRDQIRSGALAPGQQLPAEDRLADEYGVAKDTVRDALQILRSEGLIRTVRRRASYVREPAELSAVPLAGPARVRARMPTPEERRELRLDEGVPVLVVDRAGQLEVLPGDRVELDVP
jgi:GntR family transcriptional regulator